MTQSKELHFFTVVRRKSEEKRSQKKGFPPLWDIWQIKVSEWLVTILIPSKHTVHAHTMEFDLLDSVGHQMRAEMAQQQKRRQHGPWKAWKKIHERHNVCYPFYVLHHFTDLLVHSSSNGPWKELKYHSLQTVTKIRKQKLLVSRVSRMPMLPHLILPPGSP